MNKEKLTYREKFDLAMEMGCVLVPTEEEYNKSQETENSEKE